ncbi:MAG: hypothetical protein KDE54_32350, partial [Caldilineaceae bacterium]|nr:hypothetical protein [Caldilineaceae bacterium]
MMQKLRKIGLVVAILTSLLLSACAVPGNAPSEQGSVAANSGEKVKIRWWHIWAADGPEGTNWQVLADEYMAEHP